MNWNPNENDPWGKRNNNPPDLDEAINQFRKMFSGGGGGKGRHLNLILNSSHI